MSCKESKAAAAAAAAAAMDNGKYVRYTPEQVEALERLYHDCPKPSSMRRQQLIRECPILSHIEPKQIKVWFQNRRYFEVVVFTIWFWGWWVRILNCSCFECRCREKQRKEASRLQGVNRKLSAMNKLLMEENDRLQKQVSHLVYENSYFRQHTPNVRIFQLVPAFIVSSKCCFKRSNFWNHSSLFDFLQNALPTKDTSCESVVTDGQKNHLTPQHPPRDASPAGLVGGVMIV